MRAWPHAEISYARVSIKTKKTHKLSPEFTHVHVQAQAQSTMDVRSHPKPCMLELWNLNRLIMNQLSSKCVHRNVFPPHPHPYPTFPTCRPDSEGTDSQPAGSAHNRCDGRRREPQLQGRNITQHGSDVCVWLRARAVAVTHTLVLVSWSIQASYVAVTSACRLLAPCGMQTGFNARSSNKATRGSRRRFRNCGAVEENNLRLAIFEGIKL